MTIVYSSAWCPLIFALIDRCLRVKSLCSTCLLAVVLAQGAVGYTQYALGIPAGPVSVHILGAALMWMAAVAVWARARPLPATGGASAQAPPTVERSRPTAAT